MAAALQYISSTGVAVADTGGRLAVRQPGGSQAASRAAQPRTGPHVTERHVFSLLTSIRVFQLAAAAASFCHACGMVSSPLLLLRGAARLGGARAVADAAGVDDAREHPLSNGVQLVVVRAGYGKW